MTPKSCFFLILLIASDPIYGQRLKPNQHTDPVTGPGRFEGTLRLEASPDGRTMKVMEKYSYTDWDGNKLTAEPGFISDGATIPRVAWSLIGGPWEGKYRNAAVIHDVGCVSHKFTWEITDLMFYQTMRDSNVSKTQALTMYYAVILGGPRWLKGTVTTAANEVDLDRKIEEEEREKNQLQASSRVEEPWDLAGPSGDDLDTMTIVVDKTPVTDKKLLAHGQKIQGTTYWQVHGKVAEQQINDMQKRIESREAAGKPVSPDAVLRWARTEPAPR